MDAYAIAGLCMKYELTDDETTAVEATLARTVPTTAVEAKRAAEAAIESVLRQSRGIDVKTEAEKARTAPSKPVPPSKTASF